MEIIGLAITGLLGLFPLDLCLVGVLPPILGIYPRISEHGNDERLIDDIRPGAKTNIEGKQTDSVINKRTGYLALVLTRNHFLFEQTD